MSDALNIKRYRLAYGGDDGSDVRRWKLRRVAGANDANGGGTAATMTPRPRAGQRSDAMYASPART